LAFSVGISGPIAAGAATLLVSVGAVAAMHMVTGSAPVPMPAKLAPSGVAAELAPAPKPAQPAHVVPVADAPVKHRMVAPAKPTPERAAPTAEAHKPEPARDPEPEPEAAPSEEESSRDSGPAESPDDSPDEAPSDAEPGRSEWPDRSDRWGDGSRRHSGDGYRAQLAPRRDESPAPREQSAPPAIEERSAQSEPVPSPAPERTVRKPNPGPGFGWPGDPGRHPRSDVDRARDAMNMKQQMCSQWVPGGSC
jgi:translation initiation factor IF-2